MIQSIPLKKLVPSPRNVRKSSDVLADLQLRADIGARGLLQNLVVRKGKRGKFEVEAGGRRLAELVKPPKILSFQAPAIQRPEVASATFLNCQLTLPI